MRPTFLVATLLAFVTCARIGTVKKMTIKGLAQTGVTSKTAVKNGRVSVIVPAAKGWQRLVFDEGSEIPNIVLTKTDGSFTLVVEFNWWEELMKVDKRPAFIAVTDSTDSFSLISQIPGDMAEEGAEVTVNASPETTVAAIWQCPHGQFSSPQPACPPGVVCQSAGGMPCYELTDQSTTTADSVNLIQAADAAQSIPEPTNGNWGDYSTALLNADPTLLARLKQLLRDGGFTIEFDFPANFLASAFAVNALPKVPVPTADDANNPPSDTDSSGFYCSSFASCTTCSISACSDGNSSYYKTSGGAIYNCASVSNCTAAATAVVAACCSREEREMGGFSDAFPFLKLGGTRARCSQH